VPRSARVAAGSGAHEFATGLLSPLVVTLRKLTQAETRLRKGRKMGNFRPPFVWASSSSSDGAGTTRHFRRPSAASQHACHSCSGAALGRWSAPLHSSADSFRYEAFGHVPAMAVPRRLH